MAAAAAPSARSIVERLATRTLTLLETEYPNGIRLTLTEPTNTPVAPQTMYPAFYGCFDWHSSVHSHWQVVRAMQFVSGTAFSDAATAVLDRLLTPDAIAGEMASLAGRPSFEMPYGMAWLLRLSAELRLWDDGRARRWAEVLAPLEAHALVQFERYCTRMTCPQRGGMHNQTAFSLGLVWDSAPSLRPTVVGAARRLFGIDTAIDLRFEPSAADFLSAGLSEADLMRRVLRRDEFVTWFDAFAPDGFGVLRPVEVVDPSDGQLAHWAGLNLSRSWMMSAVADAIPLDHPSAEPLRAGARAHAVAGLATADHDDYMISHWVPTFAVYLLTQHPPHDRYRAV